ncbi:hypothetical protein GFY24_14405 [Nocardia sp. SYP-A9097]|uniref:hypothetical protein n=1 Tax=Nocardia sp. SYP-A9097 TaxID=2663237 RepID=UPI00129AC245|nr:hypothetical protein [Nocardia sp. SYP-A9097]MRH88620.1 hypothetical protein [Nocardia sp. SYP-A9097]
MLKHALEQGSSRRRWAVPAGLAFAAALLAACDSTPAAVTYGPAAPAGARLNLPVPSSGILDSAKWPNSCDLLTDTELKAILPQSSKIDHKPQKVSFFTPTGVDANGKLTAWAPPADVPAGECNLWFHLPAKWDGQNSNIDIVMRAIADPASITAFFQKERTAESKATDLGSVAGATCYSASRGTLHCAHGQYYFEISGRSDPIDDDKTDGPTWREKVLYEAIRTLVAKMS